MSPVGLPTIPARVPKCTEAARDATRVVTQQPKLPQQSSQVTRTHKDTASTKPTQKTTGEVKDPGSISFPKNPVKHGDEVKHGVKDEVKHGVKVTCKVVKGVEVAEKISHGVKISSMGKFGHVLAHAGHGVARVASKAAPVLTPISAALDLKDELDSAKNAGKATTASEKIKYATKTAVSTIFSRCNCYNCYGRSNCCWCRCGSSCSFNRCSCCSWSCCLGYKFCYK